MMISKIHSVQNKLKMIIRLVVFTINGIAVPMHKVIKINSNVNNNNNYQI